MMVEKKRNLLVAGVPADRLAGLEPLLNVAKDKTVLDCGCNEGYVAYEFAKAGAATLHAFDRYEQGVEKTRLLLEPFSIDKNVGTLDLMNPAASEMKVLKTYDIVLYLGMHHKMQQQNRDLAFKILDAMAERARLYFAVRTPASRYPAIHPRILEAGFSSWTERPQAEVGELRIYRRTSQIP